MGGVWTDFVRPHVDVTAESINATNDAEAAMFLNILRRREHRELRNASVDQCKLNGPILESVKERRAASYPATRAVFEGGFDSGLWRHLAVDNGLLPPSVRDERMLVSSFHKTQADVREQKFEYLQEPFVRHGSQYFVKGAEDIKFESDGRGGPRTKYEALFDLRPAFDALRYSFLSLVGGENLKNLQQHILRGPTELSKSNGEKMEEYIHSWRTVFAQQCVDAPPANFAARAWPLLRQCLTAETFT